MFQVDDASLTDFFDNGAYEQFVIPSYQRSYVWSNDEIENFWNDFIRRETDSSLNLIGSIILSKRKDNTKRFNVVDGQQRLITCSLLIAAIRDSWGRYFGINDGFYEIESYIVKRSVRNKDLVTKLCVAENVREVYERIIVHRTEDAETKDSDAKNIYLSYKFFIEKVSEEIFNRPKLRDEDKEKLLLKLLDNLFEIKCIRVTLEDEDDAYEVFEGFNARGVDLSISDLFKNLILSKVKGDAAKQERAINKWSEITQIVKELNISKFNLNTFLRYYWITGHTYVGERELYKKIKKETLNYEELLSDLHQAAINLRVLYSDDAFEIQNMMPKGTELKVAVKINRSLQGLRAMNTQSYIVWLIALTSARSLRLVKPSWIANSLSQIETFCFRYFGVSKQPANRIEKEFAKLSRSLQDALSQDDIKRVQTVVLNEWSNTAKLEKLLPSEEQFFEDFSTISLQSNNKVFIRYLMTKLEENLDTAEKVVDQYAVNIEHILPQKPDKEWGITGNELKENINRLGNLTIVLEKINSSIGNKPIGEKIKKLEESSLKINQNLVEFIRSEGVLWTADQISKRQLSLAQLANKAWPVS